jgi:hypothetical protein
MFANATNFYRKSGEAQRRDLCVDAMGLSPPKVMKNASVRQPLSIEPLPSPFVIPRSRGICGFRAKSRAKALHGRVKATYTPPDGFLLDWPPPAAITTYCFPFTMYVAGVARPENGNSVSHSSFPVVLSYAWNF